MAEKLSRRGLFSRFREAAIAAPAVIAVAATPALAVPAVPKNRYVRLLGKPTYHELMVSACYSSSFTLDVSAAPMAMETTMFEIENPLPMDLPDPDVLRVGDVLEGSDGVEYEVVATNLP